MNDDTSYHAPVDTDKRRDAAIQQLKAREPKARRWEYWVTWGLGVGIPCGVVAFLYFRH